MRTTNLLASAIGTWIALGGCSDMGHTEKSGAGAKQSQTSSTGSGSPGQAGSKDCANGANTSSDCKQQKDPAPRNPDSSPH